MDIGTKTDAAAVPPSFGEAVATFARIGVLSFGGPAGQIALMHKVLVEEKKWIDEPRYLSALNFCMLLPGPEAMQLATYAGWRLHGLQGGLAAGFLFVMPGALVILALSMIYGAFGKLPLVQALFVGIQAAVLAIVVEALLRISRRALKGRGDLWIAAAAFVAIFFLAVPFPVIVLAAALFGYFFRSRGVSGRDAPSGKSLPAQDAVPSSVGLGDTARTTASWLVIWIVPLAAVALTNPQAPVLRDIALFFSKMAVVTFGGAYAVLAYVAQEGVHTYRWLQPGEMLDGLGLAETTPGPLILVNAFVGYLAGLRGIGGGASVWGGVAGWALTLWATFAPCFLWIFAGAPYVERLNAEPRLKAALAAVTAAVVGVVLNLTVWFALHVLFAAVRETAWGPLKLTVPQLSSASGLAIALSVLAAVLLFGLHRGMVTVLATCAALALGAHWAG